MGLPIGVLHRTTLFFNRSQGALRHGTVASGTTPAYRSLMK
jgi:hypothetical protein